MENSTTGIGRLDCYEDMFKEITRKLYGDDPDHRTSSVQNEFETSVSYKNEDDTGNNADSDEWICQEEPLKGTDGSRIAAYHAAKATWRCYECGECMTSPARDVAEHFMGLHSARILDDVRNRNHHHHQRKDYVQSDLKLEDILSYLERVRERADRQQQQAPPARRTQETQTVPAALLPATTTTFLLHELPSGTPSQHLHTTPPTMATSSTSIAGSSGKRYTCPYCPYGTDRRDLFTRHENIHREEKPFHCYVCCKPFNRADHVKKHFLRMHREHTYELSKIRRTPTNNIKSESNGSSTMNAAYATNYNNKNYQPQVTSQAVTGVSTTAAATPSLYQAASLTTVIGTLQDASCSRRIQNSGCNSKSHVKTGPKGAQEKRYTCCYCSWSGVDNWCLKRHLNTHLKPFACTLCEYKAARAERLATHVLKVHNKRQCSRCSFLGEDATQLQLHQLHVHRINTGNVSVSASVPVSSAQPPVLLTAPTVSPAPAPTINRHEPVHPSAGRPPPGPPVFPAPATAVVPPPTTILGESNTNGRTRSRKQREPRKAMTQTDEEAEDCQKSLSEDETKDQLTPSDSIQQRNSNCYLRCYQCPDSAYARGSKKPYHTKASLTLHQLWRHKNQECKRGKVTPSATSTLLLRR